MRSSVPVNPSWLKNHSATFKRLGIGLAVVVTVLLILVGAWLNYFLAYGGNVEQVSIQSGQIRLAGVLVKRETDGPHPAAVILHGSGPHTRGMAAYRIHTNMLVRAGLAALVYDKRGAGESEGDFGDATYRDFIDDAIAAVRFLQQRTDIAPDRVGLLGSSGGGVPQRWRRQLVRLRSSSIARALRYHGSTLTCTKSKMIGRH